MFNKTRTLFPSYSGAGDVKVSLPNAPSVASAQRDIESLWDIHNSEPHVVADSDAGVEIPLPNDGFAPQGLSETSNVNETLNRGASPISDSQFKSFKTDLDDIYTERLVSDLRLSTMSVRELKEYMMENCPGALLVYNGSDPDKLIQAYSLIESLETQISTTVDRSSSPIDTKSEFLAFIKGCEAVSEAMLSSDISIRQQLLGSTENHDSLEHALTYFGLEDPIGAEPQTRLKPDEDFYDHKQAVIASECDFEIAVCQEICSGLASRAMENALKQIKPYIQSKETFDIFESCVEHCKNLAIVDAKKPAKQSLAILDELISELKTFGADAQVLKNAIRKSKSLERCINRKKLPSSLAKHKYSNKRHIDGLVRTRQLLTECATQVSSHLQEQKNLPANARTALLCELYTLLCLSDCCASIQSGDGKLKECIAHLYTAIKEELSESELKNISDLKRSVELANKDLQYTQKSKIMNTLEKAHSENSLSERKLKTLTSLIG